VGAARAAGASTQLAQLEALAAELKARLDA